ncbi:MAG: THUMP domain-containing protein [Nanoarchaeota archaeon]
MVYDCLLLRYGEIFLKGQNKGFFERKLLDNIRKIAGITKIKNVRGRLIVDYSSEHQKLKQVFGLVSYSPALLVEKDFEKIKEKAVAMLKEKKGTFKIEPKRADKRFPLTSPEINIQLGKYIEAHTSLTFKGEGYDYLLGVEINQEGAYLFTEVVNCFGGLPTGVEGKVALLVEDEASLLAGLMFMKRGCDIIPISLKEKDISLLQKFSPIALKLQVFKDFKEMDKFLGEGILVSGQNLSQLKEYPLKATVLRPLVAFWKEEIREELKRFNS